MTGLPRDKRENVCVRCCHVMNSEQIRFSFERYGWGIRLQARIASLYSDYETSDLCQGGWFPLEAAELINAPLVLAVPSAATFNSLDYQPMTCTDAGSITYVTRFSPGVRNGYLS